MAFATVDVAKQFSDESFVAKIRGGVISKLTNRLPQVMIGDTEYFDLSGRTKGEVVGEAAVKSPTPTAHPLRHIKTVKLQYTERFSDEFLVFNDQKKLNIINELAAKWMGSDFQRDLDTIVIHGINPLSGQLSTVVSDYITKAGSSILVPSTGTTADAINTDLKTAIADIADEFGANGIAFSNTAAAKLAGLKTAAGAPVYPSLGSFGLNVESFEGLKAAASKEVGEYNGVQAIVGDWDALRWGIAAEFPVDLIQYGDPDGQGDLRRYNQVALRYEVIFGFGIANPDALAVIMTPPTTD
jgi:hypothetical protein